MTKIIVLSGKGGVGKTAHATAIAHNHALSGENTLLMTMKSQKTVEQLLGTKISTDSPTRIRRNLDALALDPQSIADGGLKRKFGRLAAYGIRTAGGKQYRTVLESFPMVKEFLYLGHIKYQYEHGGYDSIIIDSPATGHGVAFFNAPQRLGNILQGVIKKKNAELNSILRAKSSEVYIVSLPQEMPVMESIELYERLTNGEETFNIGKLIINKVTPDMSHVTESDLETLAQVDPQLSNQVRRDKNETVEESTYVQELQHTFPELPAQIFPDVETASGPKVVEALAALHRGETYEP